MAFRRRQLSVKLTDGEVICPRKTVAVPAIISVSSCKQLHDGDPDGCAAIECRTHVKANAELQFLRKHSEGAKLMFSKASDRRGKSDGEDTSTDAV